MDKKRLISFDENHEVAISEAAHKSGLSFSAFVRMAALMQASKLGKHGLVLDMDSK